MGLMEPLITYSFLEGTGLKLKDTVCLPMIPHRQIKRTFKGFKSYLMVVFALIHGQMDRVNKEAEKPVTRLQRFYLKQ